MHDETIKISIVVPIYNVENYVRPCIESIIGQIYKNLEIILVDDGSTDSCPEICDSYAKKDKRIRVIHKCNGGVNSARKAGVAAAIGDYVLCVDGDDWIEKDRVEVLVREGILPSHADMIHLSGNTKEYKGKSVHCSFDIPLKLFENEEIENTVFPLLRGGREAFNMTIPWGLWMWAIRRELLIKNQMLVDDRVVIAEDMFCTCLCLAEAKSVMTIRQDGYHYIQRASSALHQNIPFDEKLFRMKVLYWAFKNQLEQKHVSEKIRKLCDRFMIFSIMIYDYGLLLQKHLDYIFPFPGVRNGARIVVYGAGKIGYRLVEHINRTKRCSIALWVDKNLNCPTVPGYTISPWDAVFSADYDFIVIAIMDAAIAKEVKNSFISDGIPEEKIATMDSDVISEDAIPDEIRNFCILNDAGD